MTDEASSGPPDWIKQLGITDAESGSKVARQSRERLLQAGQRGLKVGDLTTAHVVFSGLLARAQGFHEGAVAATDADNPYAAFTLLRAYAENAAGVLYVKDHPAQLDRFWNHGDQHPVKIGRITNYATTRLPTFADIYSELSSYAHPHGLSVLASTRVEGNKFTWQSGPTFKTRSEQILAYAWVVELANASGHLLVEMIEKLTLATSVERPSDRR